MPEEEGYERYGAYEHRCKDCGGKMRILSEQEIWENKGEKICPRCKTALERNDVYLWD